MARRSDGGLRTFNEPLKSLFTMSYATLSRQVMSCRKFFDAHCHLQDERFKGRVESLIQESLSKGVQNFVVNGTSEEDWRAVETIYLNNKLVIPSFGLHPWFVEKRSSDWDIRLVDLLEKHPNAAVGEAGLDKGSKGKLINFESQVEVLQKQLQMAKDFNRPISLHCVRAFGDMLEILKPFGNFPSGIVLHSYLGSAEMVPLFVSHGAFFSISGFLSGLSQSKAKKMLHAIPEDRLLLETDSPDALPRVDCSRLALISSESVNEHRLNHPANISVVAEIVAEYLGKSSEDVACSTYKNAQRLFLSF